MDNVWGTIRAWAARTNAHAWFQKPEPQTAPSQEEDKPPIVIWLRSIGGAGICFGMFGVFLIPPLFWWAVAAIFAGVAIVIADLWLETGLRGRLGLKLFATTIILSFAIMVAATIVFVPFPLEVYPQPNPVSYYPGTQPTGAPKWDPDWMEVNVSITNPTGNSYDDIDLLLQPKAPVAITYFIQQTSQWPGVSFTDGDHVWHETMAHDPATNKFYAVPSVILATTAGYRVHCPHLPPHSILEIRLALTTIRATATDGSADHLIEPKLTDHGIYWILRLGSDKGVYEFPKLTGGMDVSGEFTSLYRTHRVKVTVPYSDRQ
jgi:hypothetical protein